MKHVMVAGAVVLAMSVAPAFASGQKVSSAKVSKSDQEFVANAAMGNMAEIELGKIAQSKSSSASVKAFGKRMVTDHSKALAKLKTVASQQSITLPTGLDVKDQTLKDELGKLSGNAFDRAYMDAMVKDHRQDVEEFRTASQTAENPAIKQFASNTLPTLENHLKLAESTDKSVVGTSGQKSSK